MKVEQLNESMKDIVPAVKKVVKQEINDNKQIIKLFMKHIRYKMNSKYKESLTPEEVKAILSQMGDNMRMSLLAGLAITPGSLITIPLIKKISERLGFKLELKQQFPIEPTPKPVIRDEQSE